MKQNLLSTQKSLPTISVQQLEIVQNIETSIATTSGTTTNMTMDSDTEIEGGGNNDFQIKRFPSRNDN